MICLISMFTRFSSFHSCEYLSNAGTRLYPRSDHLCRKTYSQCSVHTLCGLHVGQTQVRVLGARHESQVLYRLAQGGLFRYVCPSSSCLCVQHTDYPFFSKLLDTTLKIPSPIDLEMCREHLCRRLKIVAAAASMLPAMHPGALGMPRLLTLLFCVVGETTSTLRHSK